MTFDASPPDLNRPPLQLDCHARVSVCDLTGAERFLVWAVRWAASLHDDEGFASMCLRDSFERAGLGVLLPVFRRYVALVHGAPSPCPPSARLGCWRINSVEAHTLHALACLQTDRFGDAWRTLSSLCTRSETARAMLALGEIADLMAAQGARIRVWGAVPAR